MGELLGPTKKTIKIWKLGKNRKKTNVGAATAQRYYLLLYVYSTYMKHHSFYLQLFLKATRHTLLACVTGDVTRRVTQT